MTLLFAFLVCITLLPGVSAGANPALLTNQWKARWISVPGAPAFEYGVYHFRRTFQLASRPESFLIHVTGDNRYQLFVNGERVVWGPARGDLYHWRYESVDIANRLRPGKNVLAAVVWNDGEYAAIAQNSYRSGFLLQGDGEAEQIVNSGKEWLCVRNRAYSPLPVSFADVNGYYAGPPGERVDGRLYPWGWERPDYDDSAWQPALEGRNGSPRDSVDGPNRWMLVPRSIPLMEETPERLARVRRVQGSPPPAGFLGQPVSWTIPPRSKTQLLLDQNHLTTAYPELLVSGGKGAEITLRYAEALWDAKDPRRKPHRDQIEGTIFKGNRDVFIAGGGRSLFRTLWWRTWRYLELSVETGEEPLTIEDLRGVYTGYPFQRKARFDADSAELQKILDVGWRTARLCAHETYMDCPYYEQLQYAGDTRIQALISLYMSGDARLMRNAIEQLDSSRTAEGATYSRAPSSLQQYIPPFSLWWIGMVHDYWMYTEDAAFVRRMLPGVRAVLAWYASYQKENHLLRPMPWWNYIDWVEKWPRGTPPLDQDGMSASHNLQLLLAYQWAARMEQSLGLEEWGLYYQRRARELAQFAAMQYWDAGRELYSDTLDKRSFSQHASLLAVLAGLVRGQQGRQVMEKVAAGGDLAQASIYFRYYLHEAMRQVGLGDRYLDMLDPWREALKMGLSTWPERMSFRVRSDCHAWGASPNIELFRTVLGIDSAAPGWRRVRIQPHLGKLSRASGSIPHPKGELSVKLERKNGKLEAEVNLPPGVEGEFLWQGSTTPLRPGANRLSK